MPARVGAPLPIVVLQQISVGLPVLARAVGDRRVDGVDVVAVDSGDDVPAVGLEALRRVVDEPGRDRAVDRDAVVVVDRDQLVELPGAGERAGLVADPFHQAAVAEEHVGVVVDDVVAVAVELGGEELFRERHADGVGEALAERAGRRLDAGRDAELGMARRLAVQLAEVAQLREREVVAGQVQQRIQQHRAVPVRQHEAVAAGPARIGRVVAQVPAPQLRGRSGRQGDPGESRFYLSLEDDLMRLFAAPGAMNWVMGKAFPDDVPLEAKMVTKAIERAQNTVEARNFEIRKDVLKYDEVMNEQRKVIYRRRQQILDGDDLRATRRSRPSWRRSSARCS